MTITLTFEMEAACIETKCLSLTPDTVLKLKIKTKYHHLTNSSFTIKRILSLKNGINQLSFLITCMK